MPDLLTLSRAALELDRNTSWVRGACDVLGIRPFCVGRCHLITRKNLERLRTHSDRLPRRNRRASRELETPVSA